MATAVETRGVRVFMRMLMGMIVAVLTMTTMADHRGLRMLAPLAADVNVAALPTATF